MTTKTSRRFLRLPKVRDLTGLGTTKIYELVAEGDFPKPVRLTGRSVAWVEDEVAAFIDARIADRDQSSAS